MNPYWTTKEYNIIVVYVIYLSFEWGIFIAVSFLFCNLYYLFVSFRIRSLSNHLKLISSSYIANVISYHFGVAYLNVAYGIVLSCVREEDNEDLTVFLLLFVFTAPIRLLLCIADDRVHEKA